MLKAKQKLLIWPEVRPQYSIPREWKKIKITLCNTKKYKNQAGINLTPPPPSQKIIIIIIIIRQVVKIAGAKKQKS